MQIRDNKKDDKLVEVKSLIGPVMDGLDVRMRGEIPAGLSTGYRDADALIGGLSNTDLIILAGRPAMGKSALASCLALTVAGAGKSVMYFSLEMGEEQITQRLICSIAKIDLARFRAGKINHDELDRANTAANTLYGLPIMIDDTADNTVQAIRAKVKRLQQKGAGVDLVIVDYLQLMGVQDQGRGRSREQEVSANSRALKVLAKEAGVPVLCLSQLSRKVEERPDQRPILSDLRESGAIEQDADLVTFIFRPEQAGITVNEEGQPTENIAEWIVAKNRNGPTGKVNLFFRKESATFTSLERAYAGRDYSGPDQGHD